MAHCNTIFQQMLKLIPRHHFSRLEQEHGTGRQARSFTRWNQLVHLVFIQLTARASLRDGVASLKARFKNLYHLGARPGRPGAWWVATGRSDFPNQVNNCLAFPGIFRGALDIRARAINDAMNIAAAQAIASLGGLN